jgi:hypothetical protein
MAPASGPRQSLFSETIIRKIRGTTIKSENQQRSDPSRIHRLEPQEIAVTDVPASDLILDIGGGGEGIIGRLKGDQTAIVVQVQAVSPMVPCGCCFGVPPGVVCVYCTTFGMANSSTPYKGPKFNKRQG